MVIHSDDAFAQVAYLRFKKLRLEEKSEDEFDCCWMSDVNLCPVWEADELMLPIEEIVHAKQAAQKYDDNLGTVTTHGTGAAQDGRRRSSSSDGAFIGNVSKFLSHQSDVVCAVGCTTAFDANSAEGSRHLSIAEETVVCLQNVQGMPLR